MQTPTGSLVNSKAFAIGPIALLISSLASAAIQFDEVAQTSGLGYSGESYGASWTDANLDGWPDLFVSHHRNPPSLYVNDGNGGFTDQAASVTVWQQKPDLDQHGGAWADFDNDGDPDLMVGTGRNNNNQLLRNESDLLVDRTIELNVAYPSWAGRMAVWFDFNNDSLLDFIMGQYNGVSAIIRQTAGGFVDVTTSSGSNCLLMPYGQLLDINNDSRLDLLCGKDGTFPAKAYDVHQWPFQDITSRIAPVNTVLDTELADFDGNGKQDIFYLRGTVRSSAIVQVGPRSFEAALVSGTKSVKFSSSGTLTVTIDWETIQDGTNFNHIKIGASGKAPAAIPFVLNPADPSVRGLIPRQATDDPSVYIGYDVATSTWTISQISGSEFSDVYVLVSSTADIAGLSSTGFWASERALPPVLQLSNGAGFVDATAAAGLTAPVSCSSAAAGDFDNDADMDLYLVCRTGAENLPNRLFENLGGGVFQAVSNAGGASGPTGAAVASAAGTADSVVAADYNADGYLDLFVTNGLNMRPMGAGGPQLLFRNRGGTNHWIELDLAGVTSNRDGVGARVFATSGATTQLREQNGRYHRWSQHDRRLHFGIGQSMTADLRIEWPSGQVDFHSNVAANRIYKALENGALTVVPIGLPLAPTVFVSDANVAESAIDAVVTVNLQPAAAQPVTVNYSTQNGTAIAGQDYQAVTGSLTFDVGETSAAIPLTLLDDSSAEGNETFSVELSNPINATLGNSVSHFTIIDNDAGMCGPPVYGPSTDRAVFLWKDCGTGAWHTRFTAAGGYVLYAGSVDADRTLSSVVPFSVEATDVLDSSSSPQAIAFEMRVSPPNQDGFSFSAPVGTKYCVKLSSGSGGGGTILIGPSRVSVVSPFDPDTLGPCASAPPTLKVTGASAIESASAVSMSISLSPLANFPVSVDFTTSDGTATAGTDFVGQGGSLVFEPGAGTKMVAIALLDDSVTEGDESFQVVLSNPTNAAIGIANATGTIVDNEQLECGGPTYSPATDRALLIWLDCSSGAWVARATAAGGYTRYVGSLVANAAFSAVTSYSFETGDVLNNSIPQRIDFVLNMGPPYEDGLGFRIPSGSDVCVSVSAPVGPSVLIGPQRRAVTSPFNLRTLGPC